MANHEAERTKTAQLTANTVDKVTLASFFTSVEVLNLDGSAEIWVRVDGATVPTVGGDDCHVVPSAIASIILPSTADGSTDVRLISTGTPRYHVRGLED